MRYRRVGVAVDLKQTDPDRLIERTMRLTGEGELYLLHVLRLYDCARLDGFESSCVEQEYYRAHTALDELAERFAIEKSRCCLIVGPIFESIRDFVADNELDLLVVGEDKELEMAPLDVVSGAVNAADCDLLLVA